MLSNSRCSIMLSCRRTKFVHKGTGSYRDSIFEAHELFMDALQKVRRGEGTRSVLLPPLQKASLSKSEQSYELLCKKIRMSNKVL